MRSSCGCFEGRLGLDELKGIVLVAVKQEVQKVYDARQVRRQAISQQHSSKQVIENEIKQLVSQVVLLEQRNITLFENFADGKIDKDAYVEAKAANVTEVEKANARIEVLNNQLAIDEAVPEADDVDEPILNGILSATDVTGKVLSLVDRVIVFDEERIEVRFAFADAMPMPVQNEIGMVK